MRRYLQSPLQNDLGKKILLLSGPRQVGKTTLSKQLTKNFDYFNFDAPEDRLALMKKSWDRQQALIIFDELHKMKNWKSWIKGVYDKEGLKPALLVTGSARLDIAKKMGDSLAGRFFQYRLHPLDLKELNDLNNRDLESCFDRLMKFGGFPEPYLTAETSAYRRWKSSHTDIILRQDLISLENLRNITSIETLIELLRTRVGAPVSYSSLARDLACSPKTIKEWLRILENLFVIFKVTPFHHNVARSLLKEPKYYFYDTGHVLGDDGARFENIVACALLKEIHLQEDVAGKKGGLYYLKTKDGREVDFLVVQDRQAMLMLECKWSETDISPHLRVFKKNFPKIRTIQLVRHLVRESTFPDGLELRRAIPWLTKRDFSHQ